MDKRQLKKHYKKTGGRPMTPEQQIEFYRLMDAPREPITHFILPRECADMIRQAQIQAVVSLDQFAKMIGRLD